MFALDTNTPIHFFKGMDRVGEHLLAQSPADVASPAIVPYELEAGIAQSRQLSRRREQLDLLLELTTVLPFDRPAGRRGRVHSPSRRTPIDPIDTLIAGTALAQGAVLATRNVREFRRVRGLKVIDWF